MRDHTQTLHVCLQMDPTVDCQLSGYTVEGNGCTVLQCTLGSSPGPSIFSSLRIEQHKSTQVVIPSNLRIVLGNNTLALAESFIILKSHEALHEISKSDSIVHMSCAVSSQFKKTRNCAHELHVDFRLLAPAHLTSVRWRWLKTNLARHFVWKLHPVHGSSWFVAKGMHKVNMTQLTL